MSRIILNELDHLYCDENVHTDTEGIFFLEEYPELLRLCIDRANKLLFMCRGTTDERVYEMPWPDAYLDYWKCNGQKLRIWSNMWEDMRGLVVTYANGSFTSEWIFVPSDTRDIIMTSGSTYFLCGIDYRSAKLYQNLNKENPLWSLQVSSPGIRFSAVGQFFVVGSRVYVVNDGSVEFKGDFDIPGSWDVYKLTPVGDRYFIAIGRSKVVIIDCITMEVVAFDHALYSRSLSLAARNLGRVMELVVLTSSYHLYKTTIPLECLSSEQELSSLGNVDFSTCSLDEQEPATYTIGCSVNSESTSTEQEPVDSVVRSVSGVPSTVQKLVQLFYEQEQRRASEREQAKEDMEREKAALLAKVAALEEKIAKM